VRAQQIFAFALRWRWLWLLGMALAGVLSYQVSSQLPRAYQAQTKLLVGSPDLTSGAGDFGAPQTVSQLTATYSQVITTSPVLEAAAAAGGLDLSPVEAGSLVSAAPVGGTQLIQITVRAGDAEFAATFANLVAAAFMQRIEASQTGRYAAVEASLVRQVDQLAAMQDDLTRRVADLQEQPPSTTRDEALLPVQFQLTQAQASYSSAQRSYQDVLLAKARSTNPITIVEPATVPAEPVQSQIRQNVLAAAGIGLVLTLLIAYVIEQHLDDRLLRLGRVEHLTGLEPLGAIPTIQRPRNGLNRGEADNVFHLLGARILIALGRQKGVALVVTGTRSGDGATTVALSLAVTFAQTGKRVILIDTNLAQPALHKLLGVENGIGLTSLLTHPLTTPVNGCLVDHARPGLQLLLAGPAVSNSSALLGSERMRQYMADLRGMADVIILDARLLPALGGTPVLTSWADGVVLVADARRTRAGEVSRTATIVRGAGANLLGVVLNHLNSTSGLLPYESGFQEPIPAAGNSSTSRRVPTSASINP
jgi:capsular exopolysaccharide synthesis family protein